MSLAAGQKKGIIRKKNKQGTIRFLDKLKNKIQNTVLFIFNTNDKHRILEYCQFLYLMNIHSRVQFFSFFFYFYKKSKNAVQWKSNPCTIRVWKVSFEFELENKIKMEKFVNCYFCPNIEFWILTLKLHQFLDWRTNFEVTYFYFSLFIFKWILQGCKSVS